MYHYPVLAVQYQDIFTFTLISSSFTLNFSHFLSFQINFLFFFPLLLSFLKSIKSIISISVYRCPVLAVQCLDTLTTKNWLVQSWKVTKIYIIVIVSPSQNLSLQICLNFQSWEGKYLAAGDQGEILMKSL